jgi:N utilization substance protein A
MPDEVLEYDIDLDEFADEIDGWVIDEFKKVGCDTALSVLELSDEDLARRTDLEIETIRDVRRILEAEFKEDEEA